jgi:GH35 family endo-1,4-beta-xylanase
MAETPEQIAQHYSAAMESVNLINEIVASGDTDAETVTVKKRNQEHLKIMLAKDFWTTEDLQPFHDAVNA